MPTEIRTRFTTGTYVATVRGDKRTASNTMGARWAAEALALSYYAEESGRGL